MIWFVIQKQKHKKRKKNYSEPLPLKDIRSSHHPPTLVTGTFPTGLFFSVFSPLGFPGPSWEKTGGEKTAGKKPQGKDRRGKDLSPKIVVSAFGQMSVCCILGLEM